MICPAVHLERVCCHPTDVSTKLACALAMRQGQPEREYFISRPEGKGTYVKAFRAFCLDEAAYQG